MAGITARVLGTELGTSSCPIFTAFQNMEEVQKETIQAAKAIYNIYSDKAFDEDLPLFLNITVLSMTVVAVTFFVHATIIVIKHMNR